MRNSSGSIYYFLRFIKQRTGLAPQALGAREERGFPEAWENPE